MVAAVWTTPQVPAVEIGHRLEEGWTRAGLLGAVWDVRPWYPFLLAPIWLAALLALPRLGAAGRKRLGTAFLALSVLIAVYEVFYIWHDYEGLLSGVLGPLEHLVAWAFVVAVLFVRPRGVPWHDVGAAISAQAFVGVLHALTFPAHDVIEWALRGHGLGTIVEVVQGRFLPAFWFAVGALVVTAAPGYLAASRPRVVTASAVAPT
jgi:hypothetical protein